MSVLNLSSREQPEAELERITELAVTLLGVLTRLHTDEPEVAIAAALQHITQTTHVEVCELVEFSELGGVERTHFPTGRATAHSPEHQPAGFLARLARGELVVVSGREDLLADTNAVRAQTGVRSMLGVPALVAGRVVCALVLQDSRVLRPWPQPLIERLQLVVTILGSALKCRSHEDALRANVAEIRRLNAQLEADNVCLKEEIKGYHDFDEIVGESAPLRLALARLAQVAPTNSNVLLLGPHRDGQGTLRPGTAREEPAPRPRTNPGQLRRSATDAGGKRAIRARERRVHRRGGDAARAVRVGRRRHDFLDEIGDLPPEIQVKFLRVLQEGNSSAWDPRAPSVWMFA